MRSLSQQSRTGICSTESSLNDWSRRTTVRNPTRSYASRCEEEAARPRKSTCPLPWQTPACPESCDTVVYISFTQSTTTGEIPKRLSAATFKRWKRTTGGNRSGVHNARCPIIHLRSRHPQPRADISVGEANNGQALQPRTDRSNLIPRRTPPSENTTFPRNPPSRILLNDNHTGARCNDSQSRRHRVRCGFRIIRCCRLSSDGWQSRSLSRRSLTAKYTS